MPDTGPRCPHCDKHGICHTCNAPMGPCKCEGSNWRDIAPWKGTDMKTDNKLVAEGLHPNDVEWLEAEVARLNKLNEWLLETLEAVLRGEISHPEIEETIKQTRRCPWCNQLAPSHAEPCLPTEAQA